MKVGPWDDIKEKYKNSCLVLGNGASMAIHQGFSYVSLRQAAQDLGLLADAGRVFEAFDTPDFEAVLRLLWHAELVNAALRVTSEPITRAYHGVRQALIETVRSTHLPFADVRDSPFAKPHDSVLGTKRDFLTTFQLVVSLNYDLLAYWAVMSARRPFVDDCFRPEGENLVFQDLPAQLRSGSTCIIYPHGNLCLAKDRHDQEVKLRAASGVDLLTTALQAWEFERYVPLFVSEGTSERKMRSIKASPYLSAAYAGIRTVTEADGLVFYGWRIGEQDQHIAEALKSRKPSRVAVSIYNPDDRDQLENTFRDLKHVFKVEPDFFAADSVGPWSIRSKERAAMAPKPTP